MLFTEAMNFKNIADFWQWFGSIAELLAANVEDVALLGELDNRIKALGPKLSWEIGPGLSKPWQFVVSPNLDRDLRTAARDIVSRAPELPWWEFHPARQPKEWDYQLQLGGDQKDKLITLDASTWTFVFLRYPDGLRELLLKGSALPAMTDDARWQAAAITLESILGEEVVIDKIDDFELVDKLEPQFAMKERPIQQLREAVVGAL